MDTPPDDPIELPPESGFRKRNVAAGVLAPETPHPTITEVSPLPLLDEKQTRVLKDLVSIDPKLINKIGITFIAKKQDPAAHFNQLRLLFPDWIPDLQEMDLHGVELRSFNFRGANFRGALLYGAALIKCDLTGADLTAAIIGNANIQGCRLQRATLDKADLSFSSIDSSLLAGAKCRKAKFLETKFAPNTTLTDADFAGADLTKAELMGVDLSTVNLAGAILIRTDLRGATLTNNNLTSEQLAEAQINGIKCDRQTRKTIQKATECVLDSIKVCLEDKEGTAEQNDDESS